MFYLGRQNRPILSANKNRPIFACPTTNLSWLILLADKIGRLYRSSVIPLKIYLQWHNGSTNIDSVCPMVALVILCSTAKQQAQTPRHHGVWKHIDGTEWPILCWCAVKKLLTHSSGVKTVADRHELAVYHNKHCGRAIRGYQRWWPWTILNSKIRGFTRFLQFFASQGQITRYAKYVVSFCQGSP